jgi:hypothetical protein
MHTGGRGEEHFMYPPKRVPPSKEFENNCASMTGNTLITFVATDLI